MYLILPDMPCLPRGQIAYSFIIQAKASNMRLGPIQRRKECNSERAGGGKGRMRGGCEK